MAVAFSLTAAPRYAQGAVLTAYPVRYFAGPPPVAGQQPNGAVSAGTATVNSLGVANFTGLEGETSYYATSPGAWVWTSFTTNPEPPGTGGGGTGLGPNTVSTEDLQNEAVTEQKIATEAVGGSKIRSEAVNTGKITEGAVTSSKIKAGAVVEQSLASEAVTAAKLAVNSVETGKIKNEAVTKEKLSSAVQTELAEKGAAGSVTVFNQAGTAQTARAAIQFEGAEARDEPTAKRTVISVSREYVDVNNFTDAAGVLHRHTSSEGATVDWGELMRLASEKAGTFGGAELKQTLKAKGTLGFSEPGEYVLKTGAVSANAKAFSKIKAPYKGTTLKFGCVLYPGVCLEGNGAGRVILTTAAALTAATTSAEPFIQIGVEGDSHVNHKRVSFIKQVGQGELGEALNRKTLPHYSFGLLMFGNGTIEGVKQEGNFAIGYVPSGNHWRSYNNKWYGWATVGYTNWARPSGNNEYHGDDFTGGYCAFYIDSGAAFVGDRIFGGYAGFGTKGPIFYKPVTGSVKHVITSLTMDSVQFEGGSGPLIGNPDRLSSTTNVRLVMTGLVGGTDPVMSKVAKADTGYPRQAFIECGSVNNFKVSGLGALASAGWGPEAAGVIAPEGCEDNEWGDLTEIIRQSRQRGLPVLKAPVTKLKNNNGWFRDPETKSWQRITFRTATAAVKEKELTRRAVPTTENGAVGKPFDKATGRSAGFSQQSVSAGEAYPAVVPDEGTPTQIYARVANGLGKGEASGGAEKFPPITRSGSSTLSANLELGAGTAAPILLYGCKPSFDGMAFLSGLGDLPTGGGVVSVNGHVVRYRSGIAKNAETAFTATLTHFTNELTALSVTAGLSAGMRVTGTGILPGTEIVGLDITGKVAYLNLKVEVTGTKEAVSCVAKAENVALLEGALVDTATRLTAAVKPNLLKGAATDKVKVESTAGFASAGVIEVQGQQIHYKSLEGTAFVECTGTGSSECFPGNPVCVAGAKTLPMKGSVRHAAKVAGLIGTPDVYNGSEAKLGSGTTTLAVTGEHLPASGRAVITAETTLPADTELLVLREEGESAKLTVTSATGFPKAGNLEIGASNVRYKKLSGNVFSELEIVTSGIHSFNPAGTAVVLKERIELAYTSRASNELKGVKIVGQTTFETAPGAKIAEVKFVGSGGVFKTEGHEVGYAGTAVASGGNYLTGLALPGTSETVTSGTALEDLTVVRGFGSGFPAGPASAVIANGASQSSFAYKKVLALAGESEIPEETGEEEEEEGGEGEVETKAGVFFIETSVEEGTTNTGQLTGGTQVATEVATKLSEATTIKVLSTAGFPSAGTITVGKGEVKYTGLSGGNTFTGCTSASSEEKIAVGKPVYLTPGKQIAADEPVRAAYGTGREGEGDKGVVRTGGEGQIVGWSLEADLGGVVLLEL